MRHNSATIPQLDSKIVQTLLDAGIDKMLIKRFLDSISSAGILIDKLAFDDMQIDFPATQPRPVVLTKEFLLAHWKEIGGRLLVAMLSADRMLRDLVLGFVNGLASLNTVVCALTSRAAIECAASYDHLSQRVGGRREKIEAQVIPLIRGEGELLDSSYDYALVEELLRFQHGARLWPTGDAPQTVDEWKAWRKQSRYESESEAAKRGEEQSIAGYMLDVLNLSQRNVLTSIEKVSTRNANMEALPLYDLLSEFCHPNADNRRLGIKCSSLKGDDAVVSFAGRACVTPTAKKGLWLGMLAMSEAIDIHIGAHDNIHDGARALIIWSASS